MKQHRAVPDRGPLQKLRSELPMLSVHSRAEDPDDYLNYYLDAYDINFQDEFTTVVYTAGYLKTENLRIFCQLWDQPGNDKGTIFIVHGYFDHSALYGHVIRFFLQLGYSVFAYDAPGHGLSDGAHASIDSFSTYTEVLRACMNWALDNDLPEPFHLFGQSMGGAVITDMLTAEYFPENHYPIGQVILFAPLIRPVLWRWGRIQYQLVRWFLKEVPRKRSNNSHDADFLTFLHNEPLQHKTLSTQWVGAMKRWIDKIEAISQPCPYDLLIVQGDDDATVDWRHNMPVYQRLYRSVAIYYLPKGKHHLVNEREDMRQEYFDWLKDKLEQAQSRGQNSATLERSKPNSADGAETPEEPLP